MAGIMRSGSEASLRRIRSREPTPPDLPQYVTDACARGGGSHNRRHRLSGPEAAALALLFLVGVFCLWFLSAAGGPDPADMGGKPGSGYGLLNGVRRPVATGGGAGRAGGVFDEWHPLAGGGGGGLGFSHNWHHAGAAERFPAAAALAAHKLLLATHNRLLWYYYETGEVRVLHEGKGVYHGVFPGDEKDANGAPTTVWVVSRPADWRAPGAREWLLHLDMESGDELGRVQLETRFTHDAVRRGQRVYVADTARGGVAELSFPDLRPLHSWRPFTPAQHVNTLAPLEPGSLWALLHNMGKSELVKLDLESGEVVQRFGDAGTKAHGLVEWSFWFVLLDSEGGALLRINRVKGEPEVLWRVGKPGKFLKGLAVVDHVAYFGIAPAAPRAARSDPALDGELAAFHLLERRLLWRRQVPTHGLLNTIAAPHLGVGCTYYAMDTGKAVLPRKDGGAVGFTKKAPWHKVGSASVGAALLAVNASAGSAAAADGPCARHNHDLAGCAADARCVVTAQSDDLLACGECAQPPCASAGSGGVAQAAGGAARAAPGAGLFGVVQNEQLAETPGGADVLRALAEGASMPAAAAWPPRIGGHWASGLPFMDGAAKRSASPADAGVQLPLIKLDVSALRAQLLAQREDIWDPQFAAASNAWVEGRAGNLARYKPGVEEVALVFSDQDGKDVFRFPWYRKFAAYLEPLLKQLVGEADMDKVVRMQFARMQPGVAIKVHRDAGGYALHGHRLHVPLVADEGVAFFVCPHAVEDARASRPLEPNCASLQVEQGLAFELNNNLPHMVVNRGRAPRIHWIIDLAESPRRPVQLAPGQRCAYVGGALRC